MLSVMLLISNTAFSQTEHYRYDVEKKVFTIDSIYNCIESEFEFDRVYYSDTAF